MDKTLIVVVGPTAIGKTDLAIHLAQHYHTEILSADSRQFYREMAIGTAKPNPEELSAATHHFIDSHSVEELFSTGDFEQEALQVLDRIFQTKDIAILVGGSGLYVDALCKGLDPLPEIDLTIRAALNALHEKEGISAIQKQLQELDLEYFARVDQHNPQRMIRGLEVVLSTGQKLSTLQTSSQKSRPFRIIKIGLNLDRALLYQRINERVDRMLEKGLIAEVEALQHYKYLNALNTVGYTEIFDYLEGKCSLTEAVDKIKQNTRRFAKRQLTWFRRDENTQWFAPQDYQEIKTYIDAALA